MEHSITNLIVGVGLWEKWQQTCTLTAFTHSQRLQHNHANYAMYCWLPRSYWRHQLTWVHSCPHRQSLNLWCWTRATIALPCCLGGLNIPECNQQHHSSRHTNVFAAPLLTLIIFDHQPSLNAEAVSKQKELKQCVKLKCRKAQVDSASNLSLPDHLSKATELVKDEGSFSWLYNAYWEVLILSHRKWVSRCHKSEVWMDAGKNAFYMCLQQKLYHWPCTELPKRSITNYIFIVTRLDIWLALYWQKYAPMLGWSPLFKLSLVKHWPSSHSNIKMKQELTSQQENSGPMDRK